MSLLDLATRMLEVLYRSREPGTEIVAVEQPSTCRSSIRRPESSSNGTSSVPSIW
jgi:hypothetical protein